MAGRDRFLAGRGDHGLSGDECWSMVGELVAVEQLGAFLAMVAGDAAEGYIEVRAFCGRVGGRLDSREWYPVDRLDDAAAHLLRASLARPKMSPVRMSSRSTPMTIRRSIGSKRSSRGPRRSSRRARSRPRGRAKLHVHWWLREAIGPAGFEAAKRALATALGSDNVVDAARILRPAGTLNHKHVPPRRVELVEWAPERRYSVEQVVGALGAAKSLASRQQGAQP